MAGEEDRREGEGFLAAWSRRKRAAAQADIEAEPLDNAADAETADALAAEAGVEEAAAEAEPEITVEELAALPPVEEISGDTDLKPFLKRGVPDNLRKAAMRKVWLSKSLIRDHDDPAVDYAWDWNAPEGVPGAGGTIAEDKVSKMVDDLFKSDRKPAEAEDEANAAPDAGAEVDNGPADPLGSERAPDTEPVPPSDPARLSDSPTNAEGQMPAPPEREAGESRPTAPDSDPGTPVTARRHGGALPE